MTDRPVKHLLALVVFIGASVMRAPVARADCGSDGFDSTPSRAVIGGEILVTGSTLACEMACSRRPLIGCGVIAGDEGSSLVKAQAFAVVLGQDHSAATRREWRLVLVSQQDQNAFGRFSIRVRIPDEASPGPAEPGFRARTLDQGQPQGGWWRIQLVAGDAQADRSTAPMPVELDPGRPDLSFEETNLWRNGPWGVGGAALLVALGLSLRYRGRRDLSAIRGDPG